MKVVYIHHGQVPGGAPTSLRVLAEGVGQQAIDINRVIACAYPQMMPFFDELDNIRVEKYPESLILLGKKLIGWSPVFTLQNIRLVLRQILSVRQIIAEEEAWLRDQAPDIVHLNSSVLWTSAIAAKRAGIPVVWHVRETLYGSRFNLKKLMYGHFIRKTADKVIAISPTEADSLGVDRNDKVEIIYNAVSLTDYDPEKQDKLRARKQLGLSDDAFIALSLGGFSYRKGAWQLMRALKTLPHNIQFAIAGDLLPKYSSSVGAYTRFRWKLEDCMVALGLQSTQMWQYASRVASQIPKGETRLHCPGHIDDIPLWISACDVLVFAGTISHFARPVYEAWAMRRPVVAFDTPSMRCEIDDGLDGFLVPRERPTELAKVLVRLAENPELCAGMGQKGQHKAVDRFDRTKNTKKVIDVYRSLVRCPPFETEA